MRVGLLWRILLPIVGITASLIIAVGVTSYMQSSRALEIAAIENTRGEATSLKRMITYMLDDSEDELTRIVKTEVLSSFLEDSQGGLIANEDEEYMNTWLRSIIENQRIISRLNLFDINGTLIASSADTAVGQNFKEREYVTEALLGKTYTSKPFKSSIQKNGVIIISTPVKESGMIVGAVSAVIPLRSLYEYAFKDVEVYSAGYAYAVNADGVLLIHKNEDWAFKDDLPGVEDYKKMGILGEGSLEIINADGHPSFTYFTKEPRTDMTLVVQAEKADAFASLTALGKSALYLNIFGILLATATVLIVLLPVIRVIKNGAAYAEEIASGNLSGELKVSRKDELGTLASALRHIPQVLTEIIQEYHFLEKSIASGQIESLGNVDKFSGEFADLVKGTNVIFQQYQNILNAFTIPVAVYDKDLRLTWVNKVGVEICGEEIPIGKKDSGVMGREDDGTPEDALKIAVTTLKPASAESRAHPPGVPGLELYLSYTAIPFIDAKGALSTVFIVANDITALKNSQSTILEVADQAQDISVRVATASSELASQVDEVNRGTDVQRERVTSTATAMEEMNATVLEVARNAGEASQQAELVREKADEGSSLVGLVVEAISNVNSVATELEVNMQQLGVQAQSIGSVINVISDIADQTNLLALNAAIEAARAGDAGRGFAVVADEVRKLAEKTMTATTEVGVSIKGIQESTQGNIQRVGDAATGIAKATELATVSGEALNDILVLVSAHSALISSIATAAEEQSATSEEINVSIEDINKIANATSDGMEESAASVQELAEMAQELRTLLDRLKS